MQVAEKIYSKMNSIIIEPLILLLGGGALIMFFYGLMIFLFNPEEDLKRKEGKKHIMYGLFGLFLIFAVWGVINFLGATLHSIETI